MGELMVVDGNGHGIHYPCEWLYKVIGCDKESVHDAVAESIPDRTYNIVASNESKTGKYLSFNVTVMVYDETCRNTIYKKLRSHNDIKIVL
ncbi:MAG: DUF493 domain-containing protein [Candidatus Kuenenia sp.]|nr:DUF493 domain-containing protein [Candidatus Kuenenia hertensis]